ncbi:MAG: TfpX/TfpZ family type IV pilin accessory protein [Pseudomonadota bacterium]
MFNWKDRLRASGIHLGISLVLAAGAAALVFGLWYPYPYREISGGRELFLLVVAVDVVMGPLITLAIFNRAKPRTELRRDLAIVGLLQLAALVYGLWTVSVARPVHLVFEYKLFRVVHAIDVAEEALPQAPAALQRLPLFGPTTLSLRPFKDPKEQYDATVVALAGGSLSAQPALWQPYEAARADVLREAKPAAELWQRFPAQKGLIDDAVARTGRPASSLVTVPMAGRNTFWTVLLDPNSARVLGFLPLDSF